MSDWVGKMVVVYLLSGMDRGMGTSHLGNRCEVIGVDTDGIIVKSLPFGTMFYPYHRIHFIQLDGGEIE